MTKYWQANPNHYAEWGEKGGLPIEQLTIPPGRFLDVIGLLVDQDGKAIRDNNGVFILIGTITILYGGAGRTPINQRERQFERELPAASPAYTSDINLTNTANPGGGGIPVGPYVYTNGVNWFVSADYADATAPGMTLGYLIDAGGGIIQANTGVSGSALVVSIVGGNVFVS